MSSSFNQSSSSSVGGVCGCSIVTAEVDLDGGASWFVGLLSPPVCSDRCGFSGVAGVGVVDIVDDFFIDGRLTLNIFCACSSWLISCCCVSIVWFKRWNWWWSRPCWWCSVPWPSFVGRVDNCGWPIPVEKGFTSNEQNCTGCMPVGHIQPLVAIALVLVACPMTVVGDNCEGALAGARWMSVEDKLGPLSVKPSGFVAVDEGKQLALLISRRLMSRLLDLLRDGPQALAGRGPRCGIGDRSLSLLDDTWRRWHRALLCSIGGALGTGAGCTVVFNRPVSLTESMAQVWLSGVSALNISVARRWGAACWAGGTVTSGKTEVNRSISPSRLATLALSISLVFLASFLSLLFLKDRAWSLYTDRHVIAPAIMIRIIAMVLPMAAPRSSVEVSVSGGGGGAW